MKRLIIFIFILTFISLGAEAQKSSELDEYLLGALTDLKIEDYSKSFGGKWNESNLEQEVIDDKERKGNNEQEIREEKKLSVKSGHPSIEVQVKRCIASGDDVIIDLMITCHAKWKTVDFHYRLIPEVFDDEGNYYKTEDQIARMEGKIWYEIDGKKGNEVDYVRVLVVEEDIPRKLRIIIKDVDEYASAFPSMVFPYFIYDKNGNNIDEKGFAITIKNLPITREQ